MSILLIHSYSKGPLSKLPIVSLSPTYSLLRVGEVSCNARDEREQLADLTVFRFCVQPEGKMTNET